MTKIDRLVKEIESLEIEELKELFDRLADTLDLLGWFNFYNAKFY